jgi:hypothetical protein
MQQEQQEQESFMNIEDVLNLHAVTDSALHNDLQISRSSRQFFSTKGTKWFGLKLTKSCMETLPHFAQNTDTCGCFSLHTRGISMP